MVRATERLPVARNIAALMSFNSGTNSAGFGIREIDVVAVMTALLRVSWSTSSPHRRSGSPGCDSDPERISASFRPRREKARGAEAPAYPAGVSASARMCVIGLLLTR